MFDVVGLFWKCFSEGIESWNIGDECGGEGLDACPCGAIYLHAGLFEVEGEANYCYYDKEYSEGEEEEDAKLSAGCKRKKIRFLMG